jgi:hypothetical protein
VDLSDEPEKQLRFKTIERFGGKKGDLSKAVNEAISTWIAKKVWLRKKLLSSAGIKRRQQEKRETSRSKISPNNT